MQGRMKVRKVRMKRQLDFGGGGDGKKRSTLLSARRTSQLFTATARTSSIQLHGTIAYNVRLVYNKGAIKSVFQMISCLLRFQDTVALQPSTFSTPAEQAIINVLNKKYANKVLHDVGLCICVFDIAQAGEGKVRYGDGCFWHRGERHENPSPSLLH